LGGSKIYADQTQNPGDPGYIDGSSSTFDYTQSTDTTGAGTPGGDYAIFTGLTGSTVTVSEDIVSGNSSAANLSSIEIVNTSVPEPSSIGLLGVSAVGFLARFRRRSA
jgi:PEP-CTERM motif